MFSVVIPLYNKEISIQQTINSVLEQTFTDFEIIVVNDGSTDNSLEVVTQIQDPRIRIINKSNGGVSSARNRGIKEAKSEWIAFLDGDDLWDKRHLYTIAGMIYRYPENKIFCTSYIRSNQSKSKIEDESVELIEDYFKSAIINHFFWTSVAVINREVFQKVGLFKEYLSRGEDLELWTRIGREYQFVRSKLITAVYRIEAENRSDKSFNIEKSRLFNYDFTDSQSESETAYYHRQIISNLISLLRSRDFRNFMRLKNKHRGKISYFDIIKKIRKK